MWTETRAVGADRLTPGEEALWLLQRLAPDRGLANVAVAMQTVEPLRWWPLHEAFGWMVARHPPLRGRFPLRDGVPVRVIAAADEVEVEVDLVDIEPGATADALREYAARPFDLTTDLPVRLAWVRAGGEQLLCLVAHHMVIDPLSLDVLLTELRQGYEELARSATPPELPPPLASPPTWPRPESLRYWREQLAGVDPAGMRLEPGSAPGPSPTFAAAEVELWLGSDTSTRIRELRSRSRGTDSAVLLAAYLTALCSLGAAPDALVGLVVNTRGSTQGNSLGYHVATLPVRVPVDPDGTLADLTTSLAPRMWAALEHADVSFETLVPELVADRDDPAWWRSGLIRHLFNHRQTVVGAGVGPTNTAAVREVHNGLSRFDLELTVLQVGPEYLARLVYSTEVHDESFARGLLERIESLIAQAAADPGRAIRDLDPRTAAERELVRRVNDTAVRWTGPDTVPALIAGVAAESAAVAIVDGDRRIPYRALAAGAGRVADLLRQHGVAPGAVVAVATPRGPELAAAVLGVWSVGAAYLPLEAEQPGPWLRQQLDDAGVRVVLDGPLRPAAGWAGRTVIAVPPVPEQSTVDESGPGPVPVAPGDLAYLIYTSGSTGRPKGVRISHGNLYNLIRHFAERLGADAGTRMLWLTTFAFDISVLELLLPLVLGGQVVVGPDALRSVPGRLAELVAREDVTVVQATPTTWRLALTGPADWLAGRTVLCGGEPLPRALARRLRDSGAHAYNVYGPTETTVWSTVADLADEDPDRITVGTPIANTRAYVLDPAGRPRPALVAGELCLAGDGVALGYHDQPELTAERFPTDPALGRYYRTGDLARLLPDGRVELRGRGDRQVKLRGHRIELGEVEDVLAGHPEVGAAAVVLRGEPDGDGYLAAFVVAGHRPGLAEDVWTYARTRLPSHRLPGRITVLDRLPETANGKVDLVGLAAHRAEPEPEPAAVEAAAPAAGDLEQRLVAAWRDVLGSPGLDRQANFFLSGGSSLQAALLAERVSQWHPGPVPMMAIFQAPTPAALAELLGGPARLGP